MFGGGLKRNAAKLIGCGEEEIQAAGKVRVGAQNHALVATGTTLHQLRMPWPGIAKVKEEVATFPLKGLTFESGQWNVRLLRNGAEEAKFRVIKANYPRELQVFFEKRGAMVRGKKD